MSTLKIKTEPATATAATAAAVDVRVKLEPSLSTADIKLEQHSSDVDAKVEFDSDTDSEEDYIKSESDEDDDDSEDTDQNQFTITPNKQRKFICKHFGCGRGFSSTCNLKRHQHEHRLQTEINILGTAHTLTRLSLKDRWSCPIPGCVSTTKTVNSLCDHIRRDHGDTVSQQQQLPVHMTRSKRYFVGVDGFYMNGIRFGYHTTTGVFICYECRLVPDCLLTHLQQKHGYDEKSINNSALPGSAVTANADPNINQHTSNQHLSSAIREPYLQQQHQDIIQGWLCTVSNCGYCGYTSFSKSDHKKKKHQGEQITTVPVLVFRLLYSKSNACYFLITRIDQASGPVTTSSNRVSKHKLDHSHNGLNTPDENEDDASENETTDASNQKRQYVCDHDNCGLFFNSADQLRMHRREHNSEVVINVYGTTFALRRRSLDDRWACPIPDCETACKTVLTTRSHIRNVHGTLMKQKRANIEDSDSQQQQQIIKRRQRSSHYLKVDGFYVCGTKCGYHKNTGLFICHECRLVPECLLTHLQQKHGYDEKSIESAILPESARINGSDPNGNQHTSSSLLAAAIREPSQLHHPDIIQGWLCVTSDCGFCCFTKRSTHDHQHREHRGEQLLTVPALVLRLLYGKAQTSSFLITRLDKITTNSVKSINSASQHSDECDGDDGDELVLSDYSDEDDIN